MRRAHVLILLLAAATTAAAGGCSVSARAGLGPGETETPTADAGDIDENEEVGGADAGPNKPRKDAATTPGKDAGEPNLDGGTYAQFESLSDQELRDALHTLVDGHVSLGYDGARDAMLGVTGQFDLSGGMLECVYTGKKVSPDGTRSPNGFNTEHSWPQSLGASSEPARSDLHHLFPVDEFANSARGSLPFANTDCGGSTCSFDTGGSRRGPIIGGSDVVFQVRPTHRGNVARAIFYFAVRYQYSIDAAEEAALREWHNADPPDALEVSRNDAIESYQHNRNPFVDRPDFVARISDF